MILHKIGTVIYCVSKGWKGTKNIGARLVVAKIAGYQNIEGKIQYILKSGKIELNPITNYVFTDLEEAVEKIKTKS